MIRVPRTARSTSGFWCIAKIIRGSPAAGLMGERCRYPSRRNGSPCLLRGPPVAAYSWIGRARSRAHIARCAAEPAAIVPAELRLVAEPPLVGDFGDALPAVRIAQHGVAHQ